MTDLVWRVIFLSILALLVWILHSRIGAYPQNLPQSPHPRRDLLCALLLWGVAALVAVLSHYLLAPLLARSAPDRTLRQLLLAGIVSLPYLLLPYLSVIRPRKWTRAEVGLVWRSQSPDASIFALSVGLVSGAIAYLTDQSNISIQQLSSGELAILVYSNAFLEEFYQRGIIQSLLERSLGQQKAVLWGGLLYGLTHLAYDASMLLESKGLLVVLLALSMQILAGWLFGILFIKTRSLLPGMACHYLGNWLPSILKGLLG